MTELQVAQNQVEHYFGDLYNHFDEVPERLGLRNNTGEFAETRNENNPDLVLLLTGFGNAVKQTRQQCNEWIGRDSGIANEPAIKQMFCKPIPEQDVHATIDRIGLLQTVIRAMQLELFANLRDKKPIQELAANLRRECAGSGPMQLRYGEKWEVGDAIMSELTTRKGDPVRRLRSLAGKAITASGFEVNNGLFVPHSSDRYAKALDKSRKEEIQDYIQEGVQRGDIEPITFEVSQLQLAVNWPEYNPAMNHGTYKYKIIESISLKDND